MQIVAQTNAANRYWKAGIQFSEIGALLHELSLKLLRFPFSFHFEALKEPVGK